MMCNLPQLISVVWMAVFASGVLAMADMARAADPKPRGYKIITVFSADFCGPCKDLKAKMQGLGYRVRETEVTEQPAVDAFPLVFYVTPKGNVHRDNGQLIYNGQAEPPDPKKPVEIIFWRTK